jgi:16S rRNA (adenine1518-N6/adenine1519-N6)-dimethyltransferase
LKAKKSFGQHFLASEPIAERIAGSLSGGGLYDQVLEVGPGKGALTKFLLQKEYSLKAVEADQDMVGYLGKHFPALEGRIIEGDFLKLRLDEVMEGRPFALIGNFPYNISSQILFRMLDYRDLIPEMVGMFQLEVAERVVAPPGSKTYGIISVLVQAWYEGELLFKVKPGSFTPPPKVQSAVIRLLRKKAEPLGCDEGLFKRVVKQAFNQRRKMLRNTLKSMVSDEAVLQDGFFSRRPETLSVAEFVALTNQIASYLPK